MLNYKQKNITDVITELCDQSKEPELKMMVDELFKHFGSQSNDFLGKAVQQTRNPLLLLMQRGSDYNSPIDPLINECAKAILDNAGIDKNSRFWDSHKKVGKGFVCVQAIAELKYNRHHEKIYAKDIKILHHDNTLQSIEEGILSQFIDLNSDLWKKTLRSWEESGMIEDWVDFIEEINLCKPGNLIMRIVIEVPHVTGSKSFGYRYRISYPGDKIVRL